MPEQHSESRSAQPRGRASSRRRRPAGGGAPRDRASSPVRRGTDTAPHGGGLDDGHADTMPFAVPDAPPVPAATSFEGLGLPAELEAELGRQGVTVPFPIQAATLPGSLAGRDVLGRGRTGSGKTLAFGLALLSRIAGTRAEPRQPVALILVPTRELAQQVTDALTPYARVLKLRLTTVVGGLSIGRQAAALRGGAEVVVATPGRLRDLVGRGDCALDRVRVTVLDEADQMTDLGFLPQVTALLRQTDPSGQRMLFSATLDGGVQTLVRRFLTDPVSHSVDPSAGAVSTMSHHLLRVGTDDKRGAVVRIAAREGRVLLFLDSKRAVDRLVKALLSSGVRAAALHGGKSQAQRTRVLAQFKTGEVGALVATNVAARGIHIDDLDLVVNVDPPADHKDYLHRGGRTARAGASGTVVTLVLPEQRREVERMMAKAGVNAQASDVRSAEDPALDRVTGARTPSGVPIVIAVPAQAAPQGAHGDSARGRGRRRPANPAGRSASGTSRSSGTSGSGGAGRTGSAGSAGNSGRSFGDAGRGRSAGRRGRAA